MTNSKTMFSFTWITSANTERK